MENHRGNLSSELEKVIDFEKRNDSDFLSKQVVVSLQKEINSHVAEQLQNKSSIPEISRGLEESEEGIRKWIIKYHLDKPSFLNDPRYFYVNDDLRYETGYSVSASKGYSNKWITPDYTSEKVTRQRYPGVKTTDSQFKNVSIPIRDPKSSSQPQSERLPAEQPFKANDSDKLKNHTSPKNMERNLPRTGHNESIKTQHRAASTGSYRFIDTGYSSTFSHGQSEVSRRGNLRLLNVGKRRRQLNRSQQRSKYYHLGGSKNYIWNRIKKLLQKKPKISLFSDGKSSHNQDRSLSSNSFTLERSNKSKNPELKSGIKQIDSDDQSITQDSIIDHYQSRMLDEENLESHQITDQSTPRSSLEEQLDNKKYDQGNQKGDKVIPDVDTIEEIWDYIIEGFSINFIHKLTGVDRSFIFHLIVKMMQLNELINSVELRRKYNQNINKVKQIEKKKIVSVMASVYDSLVFMTDKWTSDDIERVVRTEDLTVRDESRSFPEESLDENDEPLSISMGQTNVLELQAMMLSKLAFYAKFNDMGSDMWENGVVLSGRNSSGSYKLTVKDILGSLVKNTQVHLHLRSMLPAFKLPKGEYKRSDFKGKQIEDLDPKIRYALESESLKMIGEIKLESLPVATFGKVWDRILHVTLKDLSDDQDTSEQLTQADQPNPDPKDGVTLVPPQSVINEREIVEDYGDSSVLIYAEEIDLL